MRQSELKKVLRLELDKLASKSFEELSKSRFPLVYKGSSEGQQFIARRFQEAAQALHVTLEYAGIQCPDDKPYIESFLGHYKTEEVYRTSYTTLAEGQVGWQLYRIWYETERVHESLDYQTPHQRLAAAPMSEVAA